MPTWASRIMLTSFAPSPIAKVIGCSFESLINLTIWKRSECRLSHSVLFLQRSSTNQEEMTKTSKLVKEDETIKCLN